MEGQLMDRAEEGFMRKYRLHAVFIAAAAVAVAVTVVMEIPVQWLILLAMLALLAAVVLMFTRVSGVIGSLVENTGRLEAIVESLEKSRSVLANIDQNTRLSETAKAIAFRDADAQTLRSAVLEKLQQQDFKTTQQIIDEIATRAGCKELAEQLRSEAARYRDATDQERINQVTEHVEKLCDNYEWAKASALIERLVAAYPSNEAVKSLRRKLVEKKQQRKKQLLSEWDDAVKHHDTDRSLQLLHELDLYLTPNEGLALQEAARDVFRTKLHNLGVQFSMAVSEKRWDEAIGTGEEIMRDFPNSRMAEEIRERWDALNQKVPG
jgi:hypothetical protein